MSAPPGTSASEPGIPNVPRPRTSRRPKTGIRPLSSRPGTASRPDTAVSGITDPELPGNQFYREDDGFDENDEEEFEDSEAEDDPFAFGRPQTGAVPRNAPTTADTYATGTTGWSGTSAATGDHAMTVPSTGVSGMPSLTSDGHTYNTSTFSPQTDTTGAIEEGRVPELAYTRDGMFSGKHNLNNGSFAFSVSTRDHPQPTSYATSEASMEDRPTARRTRSKAPLLPSTAGTTFTGTTNMTSMTSGTGYDRRSIGMTELTGDMTVPEGKTTYGDGQGGAFKDVSEQGDGVPVADYLDEEEDSPYPEVRASVSNIDDVDMPSLTFRAWLLGLLSCIIFSSMNTFFFFRTPSPFIGPLLIQVITFPIGKAAARWIPTRVFRLPRFLGGAEWSFNPGPFNIKEHGVISIMANVSISPSYSLHTIVASALYYDRPFNFGFSIVLLLSTQVTGFALAGLIHRFVVLPASMVWPQILLVCTNLNALHADDGIKTVGISRRRFLLYISAGAAAYAFLPGFLFNALSYFSWITWMAPNNVVVNQLFGVSTGLGMGFLTFDWSQITWIGNPLVFPWWATVNIAICFVALYWIAVPAIYYTNTWYTAYLPMNVNQAADRFGQPYQAMSILDSDLNLNITAYAEYSPPYISASYSMAYMIHFALITALLVHTALFHGPKIYRQLINVKTENDDIHLKLMKRYPSVPIWWYGCIVLIFGILFAVLAIELWDTGLPVWAYFIAIAIPAIYILPGTYIVALTAQGISINMLAQMIPGALFPGKPVATMLAKVFSIQTIQEAVVFTQDMKLGHYLKIPPRNTFIAQMSATIVACFTQAGIKTWLFAVVPDLCDPSQVNFLTCSATRVWFTSNVIWGLIGPARLFGPGGIYNSQLYAFVAGAVIPFVGWLAVRKWPRSFIRHFHLPAGLVSLIAMPPATGINFTSFIAVGFVFSFWLRRARFAWWSKYNFVLAGALDIGTAIGYLLVFLICTLPNLQLNWWGNTVFAETLDWTGGAVSLQAPLEGFGPDTWNL